MHKRRRILAVVAGALALIVIAVGAIVAYTWYSVAPVFAGGGRTDPIDGRVTIALFGSDAATWREGARIDSITVVSLSATTGRAMVISIPRNIVTIPFPDDSPLRTLYPDGYVCPDQEHAPCMLTMVYQTGLDHADLYPGVANPGAQATLEAVEGITGLGVNYYALVNMDGFSTLIDAIGGITLTVKTPVVVGAVDTTYYTIPAGQHHFDGKEALWYTRTRMDTSDYDRMTRQKCVMMAVLQQTDPATVATKLTSIADAAGAMAISNIPASQIPQLAGLAMDAKNLSISAISLTPPTTDPLHPDYDHIHQAVARAIAASQARDAGQPSQPDATTTPDLQLACGF